MNKLLSTTFAIVALGIASIAQADQVILASFGNTLKVEVNEETTLYYFNEDGSFSTDGGKAGTWAIEDNGDVCTYVDGATLSCGPAEEGHEVGETWQTTAADGTVTTLTLIEGRQ